MVVPPDMVVSLPVKNTRGIEDGFGNDIMAVLVVTS